MAKRFTSTDIWQEDWFLELSKEYMLAWFYIKDNCNHAGIWRPNKRQLEFITNSKIDLNEFLSLLNSEKERVVVLEDGKWYLADFISFQYGNILNENNRVHASIVKELIASKIDTCNFEVKERSIRPQDNPNQGVKDKEKDKDIDKANIIDNSISKKGFSLDDFRGLIDEALAKCIFSERFSEAAISQFKDWAKTQNKVDALRKIKSDMPVYFQREIDYLSKKYTANQIEYITEISARRMYVGLFEKDVPPSAPIKKQQLQELYSDPEPVKPTEPIQFNIPNEFK
jgi:hypothetical protein